jgi:aspartate racemase
LKLLQNPTPSILSAWFQNGYIYSKIYEMKVIGLVGGLTWVSTLDYYRLFNEMVNERIGGVEAAEVILYSVNFAVIKKLTEAGNWKEIALIISDAAKKLELAGADCLLLGANTMHKIADEVKAAINIPLIHVAEETAKVVARQSYNKVALLGTKYTMQLDFYRDKLSARGIATIIPPEPDITYINDAIYNEMSKSLFLPSTKERFIKIIRELVTEGAQGIVLGCTEIPILIKQEDCPAPVFDTTKIHAAAAVDFALS